MRDDITLEEWETVQTAVRQVARDVSSNWLNSVMADDIEQDVMVRLLESPGTLHKILNETPKTRRNFLRNIATQIASAQVDEWQHFSGNYMYDVAEVRSILEDGVLEEEPTTFEAERLDLYEAMLNMMDHGSAYVDTITDAYSAGGEIPGRKTAERQRLDKGVKALTAQMNRIGASRQREWDEGPGSRTARTNFHDQAAAKLDWLGEVGEGRH
jgi:hypothetical protein